MWKHVLLYRMISKTRLLYSTEGNLSPRHILVEDSGKMNIIVYGGYACCLPKDRDILRRARDELVMDNILSNLLRTLFRNIISLFR
jgi:hypothetical protein